MTQSSTPPANQLIQSQRYSAWRLIKLYWQSDQRRYAYGVFAVMVVMTMLLVVFDVVFSYWYNYFYDSLQAYQKNRALVLLLIFFGMAAVYIVLAVYRYYISQLFSLRWRRWLTDQFVNRWLAKRDYYYIEYFDEHTDNPDQRIQEDVGALVSGAISLSIGLIGSVTTFLAFIYVLWELSGSLHFYIGSHKIHIHGYLVWVAVIYSSVGTYLAFKIGKPLIGLNFEQQRREATFRFAAIDLRTHAENVALYQGEAHQKGVLARLFESVLQNWYAIIVRQKLLLWFTSGYNQLAVVLPLMVALPQYFGKIFKLGGLMQSLRAFSHIQEALSFFVAAYTQLAEWRAVTQRLTTFLTHLQEAEENVAHASQLVFTSNKQNEIRVEKMTISTPRGDVLLKNVSEVFVHGQHYLIKGASGIGKSTFIRAIAGIWPFALGHISLPQEQGIMYIPQKTYMPIGTLAEAMAFPAMLSSEPTENLEQALRDCHMDAFISRLNETAVWSEQLSPGEQQRLGFARILLQKPDWVFLDESTSMLDLANEAHLYHLLKIKLPHCSVVSVGHRPSLDSFHDHLVEMSKYDGTL